jgi:hypothetical protein
MTDMERDTTRFASGSPDSPANSPGPLVLVTYRDHVLFRKADPSSVRVARRQTIGWIASQDADVITIVHDRRADRDDVHRDRTSSCGLVLLRALIETIEEVGPVG